ncbi:hypothetical protein FEM48_Zijuj01G0207200 [Ziziphus jujuba var. spinosa]|uniref:Uncharacterized protein n=1 Tax=Ziziphus jujuba var. spinosa TaxID=714518 RepID=A0A978W3G4_ZIZJJ|nr:hypothetical protein FEM48_Zijuj01G0207200 [Ziziphus jujuba var. spinosa]
MRKMGIWDYIWSSADSLKRNAPDLTNIGNAAYRVVNPANLQGLEQYWPDHGSRRKIVQFTTCLAKNAAFETIKLVPDIARKVVTKSYKEVYKSDGQVNKEDNKKAMDCEDFMHQIQTAPNFGSAGHDEGIHGQAILRNVRINVHVDPHNINCSVESGYISTFPPL